VDRAHRRGRPPARPELQPDDAWLKQAGIELDRKVLADMAVNDAAGFAKLAESARAAM
jgi:hypothetical protein